MATPHPTPGVTLDELALEPARASALPVDERRRVVSRLAALIIAIEASAPPSVAPAPPAPAGDDDRLLRIPEAARLLGFARSYVYELVRRGELPAVRSGRQVRLRRSSLTEWARRHESG